MKPECCSSPSSRVTLQPSSKTSYVVLGDNAGPSKLAAIKKHALKTLSEDDFLALIGTRVGPGGPGGAPLDDKTRKKMDKEADAIKAAARELEKREKAARGCGASGGCVWVLHARVVLMRVCTGSGGAKQDVAAQLWTTRYAPQTLREICGNKGQVEKLQQWLHDWSVEGAFSACRADVHGSRSASLRAGFNKPGKSGMNIFRAVLVSGPPGIGKTTSAHLCAKLEGFTPIELNASDARSKKLVEVRHLTGHMRVLICVGLQSALNINNLSLNGWLGGTKVCRCARACLTRMLSSVGTRRRTRSVSPSPTGRVSSWTKSMACLQGIAEAWVL